VGVAEELLEGLIAGGGAGEGEEEAVEREVGGDGALVELREGERVDGAGEGGAVGLVHLYGRLGRGFGCERGREDEKAEEPGTQMPH